jgi:hypothetical protein
MHSGMGTLLLCLCAGACSGAEGAGATTSAASNDQDAALVVARACITKNGYQPTWHSTLELAKATAVHINDRVWDVSVPESGIDDAGNPVVLGKPVGLAVRIDLDAKTCAQLHLE